MDLKAILAVLFLFPHFAAADLVVFEDDFDPIDATQWTLGADVGSRGSGLAGFDFGNALHFRGTGTRSATTSAVDVSTGGRIEFDFRGGNEDIDGATLWEDTDRGEDAVLEYTLDGTNFIVMSNLDLFQFRDDSPSTTWLSVSLTLPVGAVSSSTAFRWRQLSHSNSNSWDHWGIDNVKITSTPEPNAFLLTVALAALPACSRRRRRRRRRR